MSEQIPFEPREAGIEIPEIHSGNEVAKVVEDIYTTVSKRLGSILVESNAVLCFAGIKPTADLRIPTEKETGRVDKEIMDAIQSTNLLLSRVSPELRLRSSAKSGESKIGRIVSLSPQSLIGFERVTKSTRIPGVSIFQRSEGFEGLSEWYKNLEGNLKNAQNDGKIPLGDNTIEIVIEGIELGYPDQAIYDFIDWYNTGRKKELEEANISLVGTYQEAQPLYDFYPEHANDQQIRENIVLASKVLKEFYETQWHSNLSHDPNFLALRSLREKKP